jgi:hypothetical protein
LALMGVWVCTMRISGAAVAREVSRRWPVAFLAWRWGARDAGSGGWLVQQWWGCGGQGWPLGFGADFACNARLSHAHCIYMWRTATNAIQVSKLRLASKSAVRYDRELRALAVRLPSTQASPRGPRAGVELDGCGCPWKQRCSLVLWALGPYQALALVLRARA